MVVGDGTQGGMQQFGLARLKPDGGLDPSFSGDGRRFAGFPGALAAGPRDVTIDGQGRIVVVGYAAPGGPAYTEAMAIARLRPDGSFDPSFSSDGRRLVKFGSSFTNAEGVSLDESGRIVLCGMAGEDMMVVRLQPAGALDPAFSGNGKRAVEVGASGPDVCTDVDVIGGRIVAAVEADSVSAFAAIRLLPGGAPDPSFSGDGRRVVSFDGNVEFASALAGRGDGRIAVAGHANNRMALARLLGDGGLDRSFSGDGKRLVSMGDFGTATDIAFQGGRIVAAGDVSANGAQSFAIVRLFAGGGLDPSFAGDGKRAVSFPGWVNARATGVALHDGRLTVAGRVDNGQDEMGGLQRRWAAARLLAD